MEAFTIRGDDAGGLLSTVLQLVQAEIDELGGLGVIVDRYDSTFVLEFVWHQPSFL